MQHTADAPCSPLLVHFHGDSDGIWVDLNNSSERVIDL